MRFAQNLFVPSAQVLSALGPLASRLSYYSEILQVQVEAEETQLQQVAMRQVVQAVDRLQTAD